MTEHAGTELRIGEVASLAGVNTQTLRYYEREGLLPNPRRLASGYRVYPPETVYAVRFIRHAQGLGFSLAEIRVLQRWAGGTVDHCSRVRELTLGRIAETDRRIAELETIRDSLRQLVTACDEPHPGQACPLSEAIDESTRWTIPLSQVPCPHVRS